jgi:hypothetical protein
MFNSRFAGIPNSQSIFDRGGPPRLLTRGGLTPSAVTGSGGRLHFGMVAGIKSELGRHQFGFSGRITPEFARKDVLEPIDTASITF